jgi:hypothetical protein
MFAVPLSPLSDAMQNVLIEQFCKDQEAKKEYEKHINKDFNQTVEGELELALSKALVRKLPIEISLLHDKFKEYKDMHAKFRASVHPTLSSIDHGFIALFLENANARRDYGPYAAKKLNASAIVSLKHIFVSALKECFKGTGFLRKLHNRVTEVWLKTAGEKQVVKSGAAESATAAAHSKLTIVVTSARGLPNTGAAALGANSLGVPATPSSAVPITPSGGGVELNFSDCKRDFIE